MITRDNFLLQVREKYPEYEEVEDDILYGALLKKFPEYEGQIQEPVVPIQAKEPEIEEQSDLYSKSADQLLEDELEKAAIKEKSDQEAADFYNQNVKNGVVNPEAESLEAFKKNFNSSQVTHSDDFDPKSIEETISTDFKIAPTSVEDIGEVFVPSESRAVTRKDSYENEFNMLLNEPGAKDYLIKL